MWGIQNSVSNRVTQDTNAQEEGYLRGKHDPDEAMTKPWATKRNLDLKVDKNGVLVGELDVGCKIATAHCTKAFDQLDRINVSKDVNIKFNRVTVYSDSSVLDLEIKFIRFPPNGDGSQTLGDFEKRGQT